VGIVYLNGAYLPQEEARISVEDRGFNFGDGVYEVSPIYEGRVLRPAERLARLERGLAELRISFGTDSVWEVQRELQERNGLAREPMSLFYLQVTRGVAPRYHPFPAPGTAPTVYAYAKPFRRPTEAEWEEGGTAITVPDRRWARADLKTIQLLPAVLAQEAARVAGATDAIFVRDGIALEGAHANLFCVIDGEVRTHPISHQILPGITRAFVRDAAQDASVPVVEAVTPIEELPRATEIFLTGSTTEIRPILRVDGQPVGDGRVGPLTRRLYGAFRERVERELRP